MSTPAPTVATFFDPATGTFTHVVSDPGSAAAAIIDPVLDFDLDTRRVSTHTAQALLDHVAASGLDVRWILETHAHADHLTAAQWLKARLPGARVGIGAGIRQVQETFRSRLKLEAAFASDGRQFDALFDGGDRFALGTLQAEVIDTPGHTPDSVTYLVGDAAFVGDTLFAPRYGTARCDFPGGHARTLYDSIRRLLALPAKTRLFLCHDYPAQGVAPQHLTDPRDSREHNVHLDGDPSAEQFVALREQRDATLKPPRLLEPSLRANLRAGHLDDPYFGPVHGPA